MCMLQVFLLLIRCEEAPAEETSGVFVRRLIVHFKLLDEGLEFSRLSMDIPKSLYQLIWMLTFV